jgi:hypothetical protein
MWPRYCEIGIGLWLAASPWIFGHSTPGSPYFYKDLITGIVIIALAALSWWTPVSWAHFLTSGVAFWLGFSTWYLVERPGPGAAQNEITVAIVLLLTFMLPNHASEPPAGWQKEIERTRGT